MDRHICKYAMAQNKEKPQKEVFTWTDCEVELLLESVKVFASSCLFEGKDWEGVKSKYEKNTMHISWTLSQDWSWSRTDGRVSEVTVPGYRYQRQDICQA